MAAAADVVVLVGFAVTFVETSFFSTFTVAILPFLDFVDVFTSSSFDAEELSTSSSDDSESCTAFFFDLPPGAYVFPFMGQRSRMSHL